MDPFAELLRKLVPDSVALEPARMPVWLIDRLAMMERWADEHLTGVRRELFNDLLERERRAGLHGSTVRRAKGTPDPWDMSTPDEVANAAVYYEVPWQPEAERLWDNICQAMLSDQRLTDELAQKMGENAKALPSATPERLARLRGAYKYRFGGEASPTQARHRRWSATQNDEFAEHFTDM